MRTAVRLLPFLLLVLPALGIGPAAAEDDPPLRLVEAGSLTLDGQLDEAAWQGATVLPATALEVPAASGEGPPGSTVQLTPEVHALLAEGALWLGVRLEQAPGAGIGLSGMLTATARASAADAIAFAYAPQDVRSPRYAVRGPEGSGRRAYPFEGAVGLLDPGAWSLELRLPLTSLGVVGTEAPLLLALVVRTRDAAHVSWVPAGAAWHGPATWLALAPPTGRTWPPSAVAPDVAALAEEDDLDRGRLLAWRDFLAADQWTVDVALQAAGVDPDGEGAYEPPVVAQAVAEGLLGPLGRVLALRPDLATAHVVRGHVLVVLGRPEEARLAFDAALELVPGLLEARYGRALQVDGPALARGPVGGPTDYAAARARAEQRAAEADDPLARDGAAFGLGLLDHLEGAFENALVRLDPLARRYPFQQGIVYAAERARLGGAAWSRERQFRRAEAEQDDLPRVRLELETGAVVLELYEDDVPNTVKHFVWLVRGGAYDGSVFRHVVPFLGVFGGPIADPGYAIPREFATSPSTVPGATGTVPRRRSFRGSIAFVSPDASAEGARFLITTGTALHLDEDQQVFGRVLEGQDVVDRLQLGGRLLRATVVRGRPGTEYRPFTVDGEPAPLPRR